MTIAPLYDIELESLLDDDCPCSLPSCDKPADAVVAFSCCGVSSKPGCAHHTAITVANTRDLIAKCDGAICATCKSDITAAHVVARPI